MSSSRLPSKRPRDRQFIQREWRRKDWLIQKIHELRIGKTGLRPFGSTLAKSSLQSESMGSRISFQPKDQGNKKIPLQGVYHRLKVWLLLQSERGLEPRPSTVRTRCELELATEIGTQRVLQ